MDTKGRNLTFALLFVSVLGFITLFPRERREVKVDEPAQAEQVQVIDSTTNNVETVTFTVRPQLSTESKKP